MVVPGKLLEPLHPDRSATEDASRARNVSVSRLRPSFKRRRNPRGSNKSATKKPPPMRPSGSCLSAAEVTVPKMSVVLAAVLLPMKILNFKSLAEASP